MSISKNPNELPSALRKAAILLVALGEEASANLLKQLTRRDVRSLSREVSRLGAVPGEQTETVLREFYQMHAKQQFVTQGGPEFTHRLLSKALGDEEARKIFNQLSDSNDGSSASVESLQKSDPRQLARFLHNEHPQTIALILSHLAQAQAVELLTSLPPELRTDVALRMAGLDQISPEVVAKIAAAISEKVQTVTSLNREAYAGVRAVADLCNRLDPETSQGLLEGMDAADPGMAEAIRNLMFVFEDVLSLDDAAMNEVAGRVDRKTLVMALKGTSEQIKQHFTKRMSSRAREMLFEDLDALGPVKIKDVESAQQQVIGAIRQLEQQGVVSLRGAAGEQYVV